MSKNGVKYYLRPFGYVPYSEYSILSKRDLVVKINETAFTSIELIKKTKEKIIKEYFTVNEFFKKADKIDKNLEVLINNLVTKKNNFLDNNKFFKNKKNIIFSIMNVTPDSFSDGGDNFQLENSLVAAKKMIDDGADIIDVGGESTRPGADKVEPADEALRSFANYPKIE